MLCFVKTYALDSDVMCQLGYVLPRSELQISNVMMSYFGNLIQWRDLRTEMIV